MKICNCNCNWGLGLGQYRESSDLDELGNEMAAEVEGDESLQAAEAGAADEERRRGGGRDGGHLVVVVELDDGGMDADGGQESLHDVAHAAGGAAEDDHRMLRYQPPDPHRRGFLHVDRPGRRRRRTESQFRGYGAICAALHGRRI